MVVPGKFCNFYHNLILQTVFSNTLATSKLFHNEYQLPCPLSHICLVTFISFISYTNVNQLISCTKVQILHFVIHFHLIDFLHHSTSHSHSPYLVLLILHRISSSLSLSCSNQSRLWKLGVPIDNTSTRNINCII